MAKIDLATSPATYQNAVEQREGRRKQKTSLHLPARMKEKTNDLDIGAHVLSLSTEHWLTRSVTIGDSDDQFCSPAKQRPIALARRAIKQLTRKRPKRFQY
jgi:hypothetical protein